MYTGNAQLHNNCIQAKKLFWLVKYCINVLLPKREKNNITTYDHSRMSNAIKKTFNMHYLEATSQEPVSSFNSSICCHICVQTKNISGTASKYHCPDPWDFIFLHHSIIQSLQLKGLGNAVVSIALSGFLKSLMTWCLSLNLKHKTKDLQHLTNSIKINSLISIKCTNWCNDKPIDSIILLKFFKWNVHSSYRLKT